MDGEDTPLTYHPLYGCQDKQRCLPSHRSPCASVHQQTHTTFLGHATQYDLTQYHFRFKPTCGSGVQQAGGGGDAGQ